MIVGISEVVLIGLFLLGVLLVIWCVEIFIEAIAQSAASLGISGFFLAVILAGIDLENAVLGMTAAIVELPDLALGTIFGESLFVLAVAVGIAGIIIPFRMGVPKTYLIMIVLAPVPAFTMSLGGTITRTEGAILTGLFILLVAYIFWRESRLETKYILSEELEEMVDVDGRTANGAPDGGDEEAGTWDRDVDLDLDELVPSFEHRSGRFNLMVAVLAIVGMTLGSGITVLSAEGIFAAFGISGLAFGATVLSFIASIEELALTVEPVRQNRPHLAIGNVVGSTVFYMTANVGIIALLHPIATGRVVMTVHWPFFAICLFIVTTMLTRGHITRAGGLLLIGLYIAYWAANYI